MSQRYPEHKPVAGDIFRREQYRAAKPFVEEVAGRLGEHNWKANAFARANAQPGALVGYYHLFENVEALFASRIPTQAGREMHPTRSWLRIPRDGAVDPPQQFVEKTVTTGRCLLWVTYSCQMVQNDPLTTYAIPDDYNDITPTMWSVRVDGTLIEDGGIGEDNGYQTAGAVYREPGLHKAYIPIVVDVFVQLDAGVHHVEPVCMPLLHNVASYTNDGHPMTLSHDLIIRELKA